MTIKDRSRLDDHYSRKARQEGYPARSVFKLEELDQKYDLIKPGFSVLDLGCAPGGWTLYAAKAAGPFGRVAGVDIAPPAPRGFPPQVSIIEADLLLAGPSLVSSLGPFQVVLSDMAPKTTGRRDVDQARSLALCERAWEWAKETLAPGGAFLFKIFESPEGDAFIKALAGHFARQVRLKPKATRRQSAEIYALGLGFKGLPAPEAP